MSGGWRGGGDGPHPPTINPAAWLAWLAGVASIPLVSRNPLYLSLDLLIVLVVYLSLPRRGAAARAWRLFALIGVTAALLSVGFNVLTVHSGDRPFAELPDWLPIAGGRLTWNALVYGLLSATAITTLLVGATAFNTAVRHGELVRLIPGGFAQLGIAASIALTMVPQTIAVGRDILDAQRARGHRFRGLRDGRSLVVPLLGTGLERGLALSEALEARGFGASAVDAGRPGRRRMLLVLAAALVLAALLVLGTGHLTLGFVMLAGASLSALAGLPGRARRTRLHRLRWDVASIAVAGGAVLTIALLLLVGTVLPVTLSYSPFPRLERPPFDPLTGAALLGLLAPVLWTGAKTPKLETS